ncbi:MAG: helix-turn-helix domain-containing protein [Chloroflexi bacterium]|nr:helix-turn-helix domain-containing protein [Chloroflexota bacterium]
MIEGRQIRAARALLEWSRDDLAKAAAVSVSALLRLEQGISDTRTSTVSKVLAALSAAGIEFISQPDGTVGVVVKPHSNAPSS